MSTTLVFVQKPCVVGGEAGQQKLIARGDVNNPMPMPLVCTGPRAPSKQQLTFEWGDAKLHVPVCMHANTFQNNKTIQLRTLQTETVV
jgi:hypothetical protein